MARIGVLCLLMLSLVSCGNEAVREYFEYYSSTAVIDDYIPIEAYPRDSDGCLSIPYTPSAKFSFHLRNPYEYDVIPNIRFLSAPIDPTLCTLVQDSAGMITVMLKDTDTLRDYECGGDISFKVVLNEAETHRPFPTYNFRLRCNTPPYVSGAVVCADGNGKYVLCFNLPPQSEMEKGGVQSDIVSISAGGKTSDVAIAADGSFSLDASSGFTAAPPAGLAALPGSVAFSPTAQCVYLVTGDSANSGQKQYTITVTDKKGVVGKKSVSSVAPKLGALRLLDVNGKVVSGGDVIQMPESVNAADFTLDPSQDPLNAGAGVQYEVYSMPGAKPHSSGISPAGAADLSLKAGTWKVVARAVKDLYVDGPPLTVTFTVKATGVAMGTVVLDLPQNYKMTITAPTSVQRGSSIAVSVSIKDANAQAVAITGITLALENRGTLVPNGTASGSGGSASVATDAAWPAEPYRLIVIAAVGSGYQFSQTLNITLTK